MDEPEQVPDEEPRDPVTLIESQATYDRQAVAYTLGQIRQQLAIQTLNWHTSKHTPIEEQDQHGHVRKVHPGTIARAIREQQAQVKMLEALLDAGGELPRPTDDEVPDADVAELELPETKLVVAETDLPPGVA